MLQLPKEIQTQIFDEYYALCRWDLAVYEALTTDPSFSFMVVRRLPPLPNDILLTCRGIAETAREVCRRSSRGYTGRLAIHCPRARSTACLEWFNNRCIPFLREVDHPPFFRSLTTAVAVPQHWTWIGANRNYFDQDVWRPLLTTFPHMHTFEIRARVGDIEPQSGPRSLNKMLIEGAYYNSYYIYECFNNIKYIPPDPSRGTFTFVQSYHYGVYQDPNKPGPNNWCYDGPAGHIHAGEIVLAWDWDPARSKRHLKPTDRIIYNIHQDSMKLSMGLGFRESPFLAWSCRMSLEEVEELHRVTWNIDEDFRQRVRERDLKEGWQTPFPARGEPPPLLHERHSLHEWRPDCMLPESRFS